MKSITIYIESGTMEERLLRILLKEIPITLKEGARELGISGSKMRRLCKRLASRGIIQMEGKGDHVYLRLINRDISFHGTNPSQKKSIKRKGKKKKGKDEPDGFMYGLCYSVIISLHFNRPPFQSSQSKILG